MGEATSSNIDSLLDPFHSTTVTVLPAVYPTLCSGLTLTIQSNVIVTTVRTPPLFSKRRPKYKGPPSI